MYSNCWCSCSFEAEIIKIGQSSHKMYSNNILNFQESMTILNACTKKSGNLLNTPHVFCQVAVPCFLNSFRTSPCRYYFFYEERREFGLARSRHTRDFKNGT